MRVVAKDVVPAGQQVVGFNKLKDSSADRSSQGAGEKEMNGLLLSPTKQQLENNGKKAENFHTSFLCLFVCWWKISLEDLFLKALKGPLACDGVCG